jgi:hypothetical protein
MVVSAALLLSCSQAKEDLTPLSQESLIKAGVTALNAKFCTQEPSAMKSKLKILFVVDKSSSNQDSLINGSFGGTDPTGVRRYLPLKLFTQKYVDDPSVYFGLLNFSTAAVPRQGYTNSATTIAEVVASEANPNGSNPSMPSDGGWTNFQAALNEAYNIINADIKVAKEAQEASSSAYVVFFLSDGAPFVDGTELANLQRKDGLVAQVKAIVALQKESKMFVDSIQIHTGYYFVGDELKLASEYMRDMAAAGNGQFFQFSSGDLIDFNQFSMPLRKVQKVLRDVFLESLNTVWTNGALEWDGDGDGISDKEEQRLGSNPQKEDSDGNGVSDGVELYALGKPCRDAKCAAAGAEPVTGCSVFKPATGSTLPVVRGRIDTDKDFLNDCEEQFILKSDNANFDSNSDWIPDGLAVRNKLAFIAGMNETSLDPDSDAVTNYNEVKKGTPINFANSDLLGFNPFAYELNQTSQKEGKFCYNLSISNISMINSAQKFRLHMMESTAIIDTKSYLRTAEFTLKQGQLNRVSETDFR